jgi:hypothetical protein
MRRNILLLVPLLLLSCSPVKKYLTMPQVLAWEPDIQKFEQLDKSESYPKESILFAGSSSIRLWSTLGKDMAPYPIIQRGFGGSRISDVVVYAHRIFDPHPCKAIVIFIANDITGSDQDKSPEEVATLFRVLLKTIRETHHETPVFWIETTPTGSRWKVWPQVQEMNKLVQKVCLSQKNTYFIDTDYAFLNVNGLPNDELFREDKLHLSDKGYAIWTEIIKKELNKVVAP